MNQNQWQDIKQQLRLEVGEAAFRSWLQPVDMCKAGTDQISLSVPTRFMRNWVETHYGEHIRRLVREQNPNIRSIELIITNGMKPNNDNVQLAEAGATATGAALSANGSVRATPIFAADASAAGTMGAAGSGSARSETMALLTAASAAAPAQGQTVEPALDPRYTFDNFVVGKSNELAFAAARRVAESESVTFNPLFLYGGVGLGKTHLMHAIAWHIARTRPERRVLYLSAEKFMYEFIRALRFKDTVAFKEQFRSVDVLMIDDVQFIGGKDSTQEEFFHTFNALVGDNRQVVISADKSPSDLEGLEERLKSRLGWGLVADIHPSTYELRLSILQTKAEKLDVQIPMRILEFLAQKIVSNIRELEGALNRIAAHTTLVDQPITLDSTLVLLKDLLRSHDKKISMEEIQRRVADFYGIRISDMHSARRARTVARPRQLAMYLVKQLTSQSLPEIGRAFGGRDHTTVMHAIRKVEDLLERDEKLAEDYSILSKTFSA